MATLCNNGCIDGKCGTEPEVSMFLTICVLFIYVTRLYYMHAIINNQNNVCNNMYAINMQ